MMTKFLDLNKIPNNVDVIGGIDLSGTFAHIFSKANQLPGCLFLLCTQGECSVKIHLDEFKITTNSLAVIFPSVFFQILQKSKNCRFIFLAFSSELIHSSQLFSYSINFTPYIFERPILHLSPKAGKLLRDYFLLFIRSKQLAPKLFNKEQASLAYTQLILGVGSLFKQRPDTNVKRSTDQGIIKSLLRIIINDYQKKRSINYYAEKMNLSAQYLSTAIKKVTGRTLTCIISDLVVHDAKAKLRSTELTIQEISDSLNFTDVSSFGKYFKRYAGMTPSQYRNSDD